MGRDQILPKSIYTSTYPPHPSPSPISSSNLNQGFLGSQFVLQHEESSSNKSGIITRQPVAGHWL